MNQIILSKDEIENENIRMRLEEDSLISLSSYPKTKTRQEIIEEITSSSVTKMDIPKEILENRNIKKIPEETTITYGITTKRCTLKYLPTIEDFYSSNIVSENTATELPYATPLLIIHQSEDQKWLFIQCSFYKGWLLKEDILCITEQEFSLFLNPEKFITITKPLLPFHNTYLDLGVTLPVLGVHENYFEIFIPDKEKIKIEPFYKGSCTLGYLPYTKENIINLAKSYIGIPYSWGGKKYGVDCSFFKFTRFKTFGFQIPRNTKEQERVIGLKKIDLKGKTEIEKKEILKTLDYPAIFHKEGHILLGISNTQVIHAYGDVKRVILSEIETCYGTNLFPFLTTVTCLLK